MRIDSDIVQLYLNNPSFSPAYQTIMVEALGEMQGVANRELFIKISLQANTSEMAMILTELATMTAGYHKYVAQLQTLAPYGRFLYGTTRKGVAVVFFPADYVLWTARVADAATWLDEPGKTKSSGYQMWVLGDFSKKAQAELQGLGWELHSRAQDILLPMKK